MSSSLVLARNAGRSGPQGMDRSDNEESRSKPAQTRPSVLDVGIIVKSEIDEEERCLHMASQFLRVPMKDNSNERHPNDWFYDLDYGKWIKAVRANITYSEDDHELFYYSFYSSPSTGSDPFPVRNEKTWQAALVMMCKDNRDRATFYVKNKQNKQKRPPSESSSKAQVPSKRKRSTVSPLSDAQFFSRRP